MAANFDLQRLDPTKYLLSDLFDAIRFQNTVKDFLNIVRTDPESLATKVRVLNRFIQLLNHDDAWQLAIMVGPELRLPQSYDTSEGTVLNRILEKLVDRRPAVPLSDPTSYQEKLLVKRRIREAIEYVETEGRGVVHATADEIEAVDNLADRAMSTIDRARNQNTGGN